MIIEKSGSTMGSNAAMENQVEKSVESCAGVSGGVLESRLGTATDSTLDDKGSCSTAQGSVGLGGVRGHGNILHQGLVSKDQRLVEKVLSIRDIKVIRHTVQELSLESSLLLLGFLISRIERVPGLIFFFSEWLQELIKSKAIQLRQDPRGQQALQEIYAFTNRGLSGTEALLRLHGKIDLILAKRYSHTPNQPLSQKRLIPLVEFRSAGHPNPQP